MAFYMNNSPFNCWDSHMQKGTKMKGGKRVPNCVPKSGSPVTKQKGGGTTKTCLPKDKLDNLSSEKKQELVNSKKSSGASGKYKRSSKTNVKGARKKGATLRDWFEKEDWRRVDDPSKKCGE